MMSEPCKIESDIQNRAHLCSYDDSVEAVILYPSLGMPMVLGPEQKTCSLIIATGADAWSLFGVEGDDKEAKKAYKYVDQHLRLTPIDKPKFEYACDTTRGTLCKDGKRYNVAFKSIHIWHLGTIKDGMLIANRRSPLERGNERKAFPIAVLAPRLIGPEGPYSTLSVLWEVEIELEESTCAAEIKCDEFMNWAWLVKTTDEHRKEHGNFFANCEYKHHEPQDRMIDDYLRRLVKSDKHYEHERLFEVTLTDDDGDAEGEGEAAQRKYPLPQAGQNYEQRLQSWHPVIRAKKLPLKLGHLTDTHVSVRQDTLSRSKAQVMERQRENEEVGTADGSGFVGKKVAHAFWTFKKLIAQMAKKNDTALLLTGDYVDYNLNINPRELASSIGEQWKQYNVLANAEEKGNDLYVRGLDFTLVYSLVRYAYTKHKMPVFMITGNHDAYKLPYGISPRKTGWAYGLGVLELFGLYTEGYKKRLEAASKWVEGKGDEHIPSDHNLTIYEATLAYGPSYAQTITSDFLRAEQFDWFHTLFTPFCDALLTLGSETKNNGADAKQILVLLGWGGAENLINLFDYGPLSRVGVDAQGAGILPRAKLSFSKAQQSLLKRAQELKKKSGTPIVLGTHFTLINYEHTIALTGDSITFTPSSIAFGMPWEPAAFNKANWGTCEKRQDWFYENMVFGDTKLDWHISGHSHRTGIYHVENVGTADYLKVSVSPVQDSGIPDSEVEVPDERTRFVVSSSAGPMGRQNLEGEFSGRYLRPPSGNWIDIEAKTVKQIKTIRGKWNEKPRLCVILDYVAVMNPGKAIVPIRFVEFSTNPFEKGIEFELSSDETIRNCLDLEKMTIWLFQGKRAGKGYSGQWHPINVTVEGENGTKRTLKLPDGETLESYLVPWEALQAVEDKSERAEAMKNSKNSKRQEPLKYVLQAFCEIPLNKPTIAGSEDLNIEDNWIFPLEIGVVDLETKKSKVSYHYFRRPEGEKGEVPDWWFRYKYFGDRGYTLAIDAIDPSSNATPSSQPPLQKETGNV